METFKPIKNLSDFISHGEVCEKYPWISGKMLGKWRQTKAIRAFEGKNGSIVYPLPDLINVINGEMNKCHGSLNTGDNGSGQKKGGKDSTDTGEMTEQDELSERNSLRLIYNQRKKN